MRIGVDIDGTVVDFSNKFSRHLCDKGIYVLNKDVFKYMDHYATYEATEMENCFSLDFYPRVESVLFKWHQMDKHEITFVTKRGKHSTSDEVRNAIEVLTRRWQESNFEYAKGVIFSMNKEEHAKDFDVMIEDDAGNANAIAPHCSVILINRGWNRDIPLHENVIIAEDWIEVEFIVKNLSKYQEAQAGAAI